MHTKEQTPKIVRVPRTARNVFMLEMLAPLMLLLPLLRPIDPGVVLLHGGVLSGKFGEPDRIQDGKIATAFEAGRCGMDPYQSDQPMLAAKNSHDRSSGTCKAFHCVNFHSNCPISSREIFAYLITGSVASAQQE
jgi:hypothetical protein